MVAVGFVVRSGMADCIINRAHVFDGVACINLLVANLFLGVLSRSTSSWAMAATSGGVKKGFPVRGPPA